MLRLSLKLMATVFAFAVMFGLGPVRTGFVQPAAAEKADSADKADKSSGADKADKADKTDKTDKTDKAEVETGDK